MYFITGLEKIEINDLGWLDTGAQRTFGYYSNLAVAKESVIQNKCDIFEYLYTYMLIEDIDEGFYANCDRRWLYKFNFETRVYELIDEPECMKYVCNFAIG